VVAFSGTAMVYFPFISVEVQIVVPFTWIVTPGIAPSPSTVEETVPVMTFVWANRVETPANTNKTISRINFFIRFRFRFKFM